MRLDLENILRKNHHVVDIILPDNYDRKGIDSSLFNDNIETFTNILYDFLDMYYVVDKFGKDHRARCEWRKDMEKEYSGFWDYYQKNALKLNSLLAVDSCINIISESYIGHNQEIKDKLNGLTSYSHNMLYEYSGFLTKEKIEKIDNLKHEIYSLLCSLAK